MDSRLSQRRFDDLASGILSAVCGLEISWVELDVHVSEGEKEHRPADELRAVLSDHPLTLHIALDLCGFQGWGRHTVWPRALLPAEGLAVKTLNWLTVRQQLRYMDPPHIGNKQRVGVHSSSDEKTELGEYIIAESLIDDQTLSALREF